jgi:DNA-directed RNA polymerase subunit RPC12/RpoP
MQTQKTSKIESTFILNNLCVCCGRELAHPNKGKPVYCLDCAIRMKPVKLIRVDNLKKEF